MPACFYIEVVAIITHFIYGIIYWAYEQGGNINQEIAVPVLTFLYWLVAILYLASLIAAFIQGSVKTVVSVIIFGVLGVQLAYAIMAIGAMMAILGVILLAILLSFCPFLVFLFI